ncbi:AbiJ-NTD4 domain-containing protein [Peribacillus frigoritolerans]|uniref:AbiJ-NTD4 domain-containing protein n=1 Tax=Peribacillus frigoritolerans TaxID=450367 RepID=UPI00301A5BB4
MNFSERMGYSEVKSLIQIESIDDELKNGLWNAIWEYYYSLYFNTDNSIEANYGSLKKLTKNIWLDYFKEPIDNLNFDSYKLVPSIKSYFFDPTVPWYELYDFVEFIPDNFESKRGLNERFRNYCNTILEREVSAYRFVAGQITRITTTEEIQEIEEAITNPSTNFLVKTHISKALSLLADREIPDYPNSIKESISAVECVAKVIVNKPNTTLGAALNEIERNGTIEFHADLKEGLKKIYHYTSDSAGIRHALKDNSTVDFEDAKFMLVSCSSFCNYLTAKAIKAGITIS